MDACTTNPASENAPLDSPLTTELLILPDGRVLVHNLTRPFAAILAELNPRCGQISERVADHTIPSHELPD
jgi:hypothetical protein